MSAMGFRKHTNLGYRPEHMWKQPMIALYPTLWHKTWRYPVGDVGGGRCAGLHLQRSGERRHHMATLQPDHRERGRLKALDDDAASRTRHRSSSKRESSNPTRTRTAAVRPERHAIYLDYAATTPVDPTVARTMANFLTSDGVFGNPASTTHAFGHAAAEAVECARGEVASLLHVPPEEIVWTSGATEAINLALKGVALFHRDRGNHIVTSRLEHRAVLDAVDWLETKGIKVSYVEPDDAGEITAEAVAEALRPSTILVSLMQVNNETGTITNLEAIAPLVKQSGALLHVDAAQSVARLPMGEVAELADLISVSSHKMYGPKGIGVLRVRKDCQTGLVPLMHGGGQEFGLRSGTLPTHQIAGMGHAARLVRKRLSMDVEHIRKLDNRLCAILKEIEGVQINGSRKYRVPGVLSVSLAGVQAESLVLALRDVAVSTGSACTSADIEPSHVLTALGYDVERALSSVRFSLGRFTTPHEIDRTGDQVRQAVTTLRRIAQ